MGRVSAVSVDPDVFWKRPALPLVLAFLTGIFWARFWPLSFPWALGLAGFLLLLFIPIFFFLPRFFPSDPKKPEHGNPPGRSLFSLLPFGVFLMMGHAIGLGVHLSGEQARALVAFAGEKTLVVEGRIQGLPQPRQGRVQTFLEDVHVKGPGDERREIQGRLLFTLVEALEIPLPGSLVRFEGKIRPFENFENPGGFDFRSLQHGRGVYGRIWCRGRDLKVLDPAPGGWGARVDRFRLGLGEKIHKAVGDEDATAVLRAMLIGDRSLLKPALREAYARSGLGHLLAISGLHVGLLAGAVFWGAERLFRFFPILTQQGLTARAAALPALTLAVAYALISGGAPSALRAVIMVAGGLGLLVMHRTTDVWSLLGLAVGLLLAQNPQRLVETGFLLSVSAVAGLILGFSRYPLSIHGAPGRAGLGKGLSGLCKTSIFAALFTAPICLFVFREVSVVGPWVNLVMVPLMGMLALPLGMAGLFLSLFSDLGHGLLHGAGLLVMLGNGMARICARPDFAVLRGGITLVEVGLLYGFLLLWLGFPKEGGWPRGRLLLAFFLVLASGANGVRWTLARLGPVQPTVTVLDVGQGSAAGLRLPGGGVILVDGGGFPWADSLDTGRAILSPWLDFQKIRTIDALVVSHPHADHIQGFFYLAGRYRVGELWISEAGLKEPLGRALAETFAAQGTRIRHPSPGGEVFFLGDVRFHFFGAENRIFSSVNDASLVFRMQSLGGSMLFTGDAEREAEAFYAGRYGKDLVSDVLLAGHHGSRTSTTDIFLREVNPAMVLISCGTRNRYHYPSVAVLRRLEARGTAVLRTDQGGAIHLVFGKKGPEARYTPTGPWDRLW
ncbi:DNA internalization-related competence protein ComEC/Rec2 [Desulfobotulus sp.]|uniref:DNA internalization-related competence protein ComEC/Rec2 n=1 Tax=Desulfobotulus sp. TaxID=1940337 RepID=UPI002A36AC32|nr:DNA internalization-related competence protein ComEC/Rec2 [Desulfobotulus sp.]MDY0163334.1 DNA internalization-related competence protein ComEC/Rec2 [Desulfobotulus sp.]